MNGRGCSLRNQRDPLLILGLYFAVIAPCLFDQVAVVPFIATMPDLRPGDDEHLLRIDARHRRSGKIRGRAVDPAGRPIANVSVALMQSPEEEFIFAPPGDEDGYFVADEFPVGEYRLFLTNPGSTFHTERKVRLGLGQDLDLGDVVLQARRR